MPEMARNTGTSTEFWRPPVEGLHRTPAALEVDVCERCKSEFVVGSRYCHVCGMNRVPHASSRGRRLAMLFSGLFDFGRIRKASGLNPAAFVAFLLGAFCIAATLLVGVIYDAKTVLDWQAVQIWRVQWLLAALVAFVVASLLSRPSQSN